MAAAAVPLAIASIAMTVIGTGVAAYGQMQQAQAAAQMAAYNQQVQMQAAQIAYNNSMVQNQLMAQQNALAQQQALAAQNAANQNALMVQRMSLLNQRNIQSRSEAQIMGMQNNYLISQRNAAAQDQEAQLVEMQARERARRQREQNDKVMSAIRAKHGTSNIAFEGSPLMVMAETAGLMELGVADAFYESGLQSMALRSKADSTRYGGALELWQSQFVNADSRMEQEIIAMKSAAEVQNLMLEKQSSAYEMAALQYQGSSLQRQRQLIGDQLTFDKNAARGSYMQGMNQSQAYQINSYSTLLSGFGQAAQSGYNYTSNIRTKPYG